MQTWCALDANLTNKESVARYVAATPPTEAASAMFYAAKSGDGSPGFSEWTLVFTTPHSAH
jgi:hypothetical protein